MLIFLKIGTLIHITLYLLAKIYCHRKPGTYRNNIIIAYEVIYINKNNNIWIHISTMKLTIIVIIIIMEMIW